MTAHYAVDNIWGSGQSSAEIIRRPAMAHRSKDIASESRGVLVNDAAFRYKYDVPNGATPVSG